MKKREEKTSRLDVNTEWVKSVEMFKLVTSVDTIKAENPLRAGGSKVIHALG